MQLTSFNKFVTHGREAVMQLTSFNKSYVHSCQTLELVFNFC